MKKRRSALMGIAVWVLCSGAQGQTPLIPLWTHVDPFGAGMFYPISDLMRTHIAFDVTTDRLYRSVMAPGTNGAYTVQVFDTAGIDLTPPEPLMFQVFPIVGDNLANHVVRLSAVNDELAAIVQREHLVDEELSVNWMKVQGVDGEAIWLVGSGATAMLDMQYDTSGTLILLTDELRSYAPTGWPAGSMTTGPVTRMAVLESSVVLGVPPSIARVDRATLAPMSPVPVPSTGTAISGVCLANGSSAFNYAARNANGTVDLGLADVNTGPVWSTAIPVQLGTTPTAYHVDEQGNFWIAFALGGSNGVGLLYGFSSTGDLLDFCSYGRAIDDIASSGTRLFLTGRQIGNTYGTYVAAFDINMITGVPNESVVGLRISPNPTNDLLFLLGNTVWTEGWILDATGKTVMSITQAELSNGSIAISDLDVGSYRLSVRNAKDTAQLPFVIVR